MRNLVLTAASFLLLAGLSRCGGGDDPAQLQSRVPPPPRTVVPPCVADTTTHTGVATYYSWADGSGNCMFDATPNDLRVGAINQADYDTAQACGMCVEVTGPRGTVTIRVTDRCPECAPGDIDLSPYAFSLIGDTTQGRIPIRWRLVQCDVNTPLQYHFKDGSSQWWTAVQVRNYRNPVASLEYLTASGVFRAVQRTEYNYFVEPAGMGLGPYTFRVTDIYHNAVIDEGIIPAANATLPGKGQFPVCTAPH